MIYMLRNVFSTKLPQLFTIPVEMRDNLAVTRESPEFMCQQQTNEVFSEKWTKYEHSDEKEGLYEFQRQWFLELYGFELEDTLREYHLGCEVIFDDGCGPGYKAAWVAENDA